MIPERLVLGIPPEVATFKMAAPYLGCRTGAALRMRFRRGLYPAEFLVRMTPRIPGVAVRELVAWIRDQMRKAKAHNPVVPPIIDRAAALEAEGETPAGATESHAAGDREREEIRQEAQP